jgi:hypothetical protein
MKSPPNDHTPGDGHRGQVDLDLANAQYKSEWPQLCKQLAITPFMLNRIDPRVLIAIMLVRMNALYAGKMIDLESRIYALEPHGPMMSTIRRPSDA